MSSYKTVKTTDSTSTCGSLGSSDAYWRLKSQSIKISCQLADGVSMKPNHGNVQKTLMQKARLTSTAACHFTSLFSFLKSLGQPQFKYLCQQCNATWRFVLLVAAFPLNFIISPSSVLLNTAFNTAVPFFSPFPLTYWLCNSETCR